MKLPEEALRLSIYLDESDRYHGKALHETIILKARELNLSGATVFKGIMGYGAESHIHTSKLLELSGNLPVVIEIIDNEDNINKIMPFLDTVVIEGLITMEPVKVVRYRRIH